MNAGYFSYVWMTCFIILLSCGWQIQLIGHFKRWMVVLFIGLWFVLMRLSLQWSPRFTFQRTLIVLIAVTIVAFRRLNSSTQCPQFVLMSILLTIWHGFMVYGQRFSHMNLINPALDVA